MKISVSIVVLACLISTGGAMGGSPLKGVDVKLGKTPGGGCSGRTADVKASADGSFSVKGLAQGNYDVCVAGGAPHLFKVGSNGVLIGVVDSNGKSAKQVSASAAD